MQGLQDTDFIHLLTNCHSNTVTISSTSLSQVEDATPVFGGWPNSNSHRVLVAICEQMDEISILQALHRIEAYLAYFVMRDFCRNNLQKQKQ